MLYCTIQFFLPLKARGSQGHDPSSRRDGIIILTRPGFQSNSILSLAFPLMDIKIRHPPSSLSDVAADLLKLFYVLKVWDKEKGKQVSSYCYSCFTAGNCDPPWLSTFPQEGS